MNAKTDVEKARINFLKRKERPPELIIESKSADFKKKKLEKNTIKEILKAKKITEEPMQLEPSKLDPPKVESAPSVPQENKQTIPKDEDKPSPKIPEKVIEPVKSTEKKEIPLPKTREITKQQVPTQLAKTFYPPDEILSEEMSEEESESIEFIPTQRRDVPASIPRSQTISRFVPTISTPTPITSTPPVVPTSYLSEETMAKIKDSAYNMGYVCVSRLGTVFVIVGLAFIQSWAQSHVARRTGLPVIERARTNIAPTIVNPIIPQPLHEENMSNLANNFPSFFR